VAGNLPVSNGCEVKLVWSLSGTPSALNILHFSHQPGAVMNQSVADGIGTTIRTAFSASLLPAQLTAIVSLLRVEVRHMDANSDPWFVAAGAAVPGTSASDPLPAATALAVTLLTGLRGRSFRGRVYLWGWAENANTTTGSVASTATDAGSAFVNAIRTNMVANHSYTMVVLSRFTTTPGSPPGTPAIERTPPLMTTVTAAGSLDARWDVQRRRAVPGI
jgi:hypothetical protein